MSDKLMGNTSDPESDDSSLEMKEPLDGSLLEVDHEQVVEQSFVCSICERSFRRNDNLIRHVRVTHSSENDFNCTRCTQHFLSEEAMIRHNQQKHSVKTHLCTYCGRAFMKKSTLDEHLARRHTDECSKLEFLCPFDGCNKVFARKQPYTDHLNTHTDVKPYRCSKCERQYRSLASKKRHERICSGAMECKCDICSAEYKDESSLKKHKDASHRGIVFSCFCGKKYRYASNLARHRKKDNH